METLIPWLWDDTCILDGTRDAIMAYFTTIAFTTDNVELLKAAAYSVHDCVADGLASINGTMGIRVAFFGALTAVRNCVEFLYMVLGVSVSADYLNSKATVDVFRTCMAVNETFTANDVHAARMVYSVGYPILLVLGTVGNTLNLVVLRRMPKRTSTTVYLAAMVTADLVLLWTSLPQFVLDLTDLPTGYCDGDAGCTLYWYRNVIGIVHWIQFTALLFSDGTLMVFSCERLLTSIKPLYFRNRLTPKTSLITEGVLLAVCGIYNIYEIVAPYFCLVNYPKDTDSENCNRLHPWLMTWGYLQIQIKMWLWTAKFAFIVVINGALAVSLHRAFRSDREQFPGVTAATDVSRQQNHLKSNMILFASTLLYIVTQTPLLASYVLIDLAHRLLAYHLSERTTQLLGPLVQTSVLVHYLFNFYLYFAVSRRFRDEFRAIRSELCAKWDGKRAWIPRCRQPRKSPETDVIKPCGGLAVSVGQAV